MRADLGLDHVGDKVGDDKQRHAKLQTNKNMAIKLAMISSATPFANGRAAGDFN